MIVGFLLAINFVPCMYCLCTKRGLLGNLKNVRWDPTTFFAEDIRGVKLGPHAKNGRDRLGSFLKHWKQPKHISHLFIRYTRGVSAKTSVLIFLSLYYTYIYKIGLILKAFEGIKCWYNFGLIASEKCHLLKFKNHFFPDPSRFT